MRKDKIDFSGKSFSKYDGEKWVHLPLLEVFKTIKQLQKQNEELKALEYYAYYEHTDSCNIMRINKNNECTCGLLELQNRVNTPKEGE